MEKTPGFGEVRVYPPPPQKDPKNLELFRGYIYGFRVYKGLIKRLSGDFGL